MEGDGAIRVRAESMIVECHSVEDFLANLHQAESLFTGVIRVNIHRREIKELVFEVNLQASAVVNMEDGNYLLQYGEITGSDYEDGDQEAKGTERAEEIKREIREYAAVREWPVLPGVTKL